MAFQAACAAPAGSKRSDVFGASLVRHHPAAPQRRVRRAPSAPAPVSASSEERLVSVVGASGEVGRKVVEALLQRKEFRVRAVLGRGLSCEARARALFGDRVGYAEVDVFDPASVRRGLASSDAVVSCMGTTAFPTKKWDNGNTPERVDFEAVRNLVEGTPEGLQDFVLHSSIGVQRRSSFPFTILNAFGVLDCKARGEAEVIRGARERGFAYSIVRPGQLNDKKTYPNETLILSKGDRVSGLVSREQVANVMAEALRIGAGRNSDWAVVCDPKRARAAAAPFSYEALAGTLEGPGEEVLRLSFDRLDAARLAGWLADWGLALNQRAALFPPLPAAVRATRLEDGVELAMLEARQEPDALEIEAVGKLVVRVEGGSALVVRRGSWGAPVPGEKQILALLAADLARIVSQ
eukprot:tig00000796_g4247.t1